MSAPRYIALCSVLTLVAFAGGCATTYTPPGATTAQKMKDDLSAIGIVEADVKAQCGAQFAPAGALAMSILSAAEAIGDIAAYNFAGAVQQAFIALPALIQDGQATACVFKVIQADYQKLKPKAAPPAASPPPVPAAKPSAAAELGAQVHALLQQGATVTIEGSVDAPVMSAYTQ